MKKDDVLQIRLSASEKARIKWAARRSRLTMAEFIRSAVSNELLKVTDGSFELDTPDPDKLMWYEPVEGWGA